MPFLEQTYVGGWICRLPNGLKQLKQLKQVLQARFKWFWVRRVRDVWNAAAVNRIPAAGLLPGVVQLSCGERTGSVNGGRLTDRAVQNTSTPYSRLFRGLCWKYLVPRLGYEVPYTCDGGTIGMVHRYIGSSTRAGGGKKGDNSREKLFVGPQCAGVV